MSMQVLTSLQIVWAFSAYTLSVVVLPWLLLRKRFAGRPAPDRLLACYLAGNFYLVDLVFVLQFLHISNRLTLLLGTAAPFLALYLKHHRENAGQMLKNAQRWLIQVLKGERTIKTELSRALQPLRTGTGHRLAQWLRRNGLELLCLLILAGVLFYEYGLDTIRYYGYKASDVVVHNEWIDLMDENKIFHAGVYPHGFHCTIYYLEQVFGIPTYVLLRVFSLVETFYIHLAVLVPLRGLCRSRYAPYLGVAVYALLPYLNYNTYWRYTATLPQEYGMIFIIPAGFFAIRFFQDLPKQLEAKDEAEQTSGKRLVQFDLAFFIISFSLTITVHFYDTVIAFLFCGGIALAFFRQMFNWEYFRRIIAAGLLSIALAFLPMAIGLLMGNPLQGSFYWGANIINGTATDDLEDTRENKFSVQTQSVLENLQNLELRLQRETTAAKEDDLYYGTPVAIGMMAGGFVLLLLGWLSLRRDRQEKQYRVLWAAGWLDILMLLMMEAPLLHLPNLMGGTRVSEFFNYIQAMIWPLILDEGMWLLPFGKYRLKILNAVSFGLLLVGLGLDIPLGWVRPVCTGYLFESNQAMTCTTNIIRENKPLNWTICSANEERRMISRKGYHEELITFLRTLEDVGNEELSITIPTQYVYFYIEKLPIDYYESEYDERGIMRVSEEGASQKLNEEDGLAPYKGTERWVTMSHIYYWAQVFQKLYPDDMEVYYEDDDFVCYRLTQNVDAPYDLAIDYGYNDP